VCRGGTTVPLYRREQPADERHGLREIIAGRASDAHREAIRFLFRFPHLRRPCRGDGQKPQFHAVGSEPSPMTKDVVRHFVANHERKFVIGAALIQDRSGDHHALSVRPRIDRAIRHECDLRQTSQFRGAFG
jgi:hypothetical protein